MSSEIVLKHGHEYNTLLLKFLIFS